jgi:hypothetical protein
LLRLWPEKSIFWCGRLTREPFYFGLVASLASNRHPIDTQGASFNFFPAMIVPSQNLDLLPHHHAFVFNPQTMVNPVEPIPSYTESDSTMAPRELTLIVTVTGKMRIGRGSTLPRTDLRKEMPYFARVTKHASPGVRAFFQSPIARSNSVAEYKCCNYGSQDLGESIPPNSRH